MAGKKQNFPEPRSGSESYVSVDYQSWLKAYKAMGECWMTVVSTNTDGEMRFSFIK